MKTVFSLLLALVMASSALAQGKVRLVNDSLHLVYFTTDPFWLLPGDAALAGQPYVLGDIQENLRIELWAGTSSTALALQARTDFTGQPGPGVWAGMNITLPSAAGLTFFDIVIYDAALGSYINAITTPGHYFGTSGVFTAVSSSTIAYNSLVNHNSPALSTWANGTYDMDFLSTGYRGAIMLTAGPEPSTFALGCLGSALLLMRRPAQKQK